MTKSRASRLTHDTKCGRHTLNIVSFHNFWKGQTQWSPKYRTALCMWYNRKRRYVAQLMKSSAVTAGLPFLRLFRQRWGVAGLLTSVRCPVFLLICGAQHWHWSITTVLAGPLTRSNNSQQSIAWPTLRHTFHRWFGLAYPKLSLLDVHGIVEMRPLSSACAHCFIIFPLELQSRKRVHGDEGSSCRCLSHCY